MHYQTTMLDPARPGRHKRRIGGARRRQTTCGRCNGIGKWGASGSMCLDCRGTGLVPILPVTTETAYVGRYRADGPAQ